MDLCRSEWERQQQVLAAQVTQVDVLDTTRVTRLGGLDISYTKDGDCRDGQERAVAALVVLKLPHLEIIYEGYQELIPTVPYAAGFLGFREVPAYIGLFDQVPDSLKPQVVLVDGFGILHPRGCGSASHFGVLSGVPTIGVAKALLHIPDLSERQVRADMQQQSNSEDFKAAMHKEDLRAQGCLASSPHEDACHAANLGRDTPGREKSTGNVHPLMSQGQLVGMAVRAHCGIHRPVYVSVGHKICLQSAVAIVRRCSCHRVPEPIRQADIQSRRRLQLWLQNLIP